MEVGKPGPGLEVFREKEVKEAPTLAESLDNLTDKQKQFVINTLANPQKSDRQNAIDAGYSANVPTGAIKKAVEGKIGKTLLVAGICELDLAKKIVELLNAQKTYIVHNKAKGTIETIVVPDNAIQLGMAKVLLMAGYQSASKVKVEGRMVHALEGATKAVEAMQQRQDQIIMARLQIPADCEVLDDKTN